MHLQWAPLEGCFDFPLKNELTNKEVSHQNTSAVKYSFNNVPNESILEQSLLLDNNSNCVNCNLNQTKKHHSLPDRIVSPPTENPIISELTSVKTSPTIYETLPSLINNNQEVKPAIKKIKTPKKINISPPIKVDKDLSKEDVRWSLILYLFIFVFIILSIKK